MEKRPDQNYQPERPNSDNSTTLCIEPKPGTVKAGVLNALRTGERLTPLDAWADFGTSRLAAIVNQLRNEGWPIERVMVDVECRKGRIAHVAEYFMAVAT